MDLRYVGFLPRLSITVAKANGAGQDIRGVPMVVHPFLVGVNRLIISHRRDHPMGDPVIVNVFRYDKDDHPALVRECVARSFVDFGSFVVEGVDYVVRYRRDLPSECVHSFNGHVDRDERYVVATRAPTFVTRRTPGQRRTVCALLLVASRELRRIHVLPKF